jgi:DNA polymerase I-like protein with 3'-5' exonuclease and polymerase domains
MLPSTPEQATLFSPTADVINLDSPAQVLQRLQALGIPVTNTAKWTLAPLADQYPVVSALLTYRKVAKARTFATSLPAHLHPRTGGIGKTNAIFASPLPPSACGHRSLAVTAACRSGRS